MDIVWEDPSEAALLRRQSGTYIEFALALREHPGRWAVLPGQRKDEKSAASSAQNIRRGVTKGFTKGEYEAVNDGSKVHVKFVGSASAKPEDKAGEGSDEDPSPSEEDTVPRDATLAPLVRAWARNNGLTLSDRGRIPDSVYDAYIAATKGPKAHLQPVRPPANEDAL